jgi:hypothetical protein
MFYSSLFVLLAIVVSVRLRFKDSDYPFGIFKLFLRGDIGIYIVQECITAICVI